MTQVTDEQPAYDRWATRTCSSSARRTCGTFSRNIQRPGSGWKRSRWSGWRNTREPLSRKVRIRRRYLIVAIPRSASCFIWRRAGSREFFWKSRDFPARRESRKFRQFWKSRGSVWRVSRIFKIAENFWGSRHTQNRRNTSQLNSGQFPDLTRLWFYQLSTSGIILFVCSFICDLGNLRIRITYWMFYFYPAKWCQQTLENKEKRYINIV